MAFIGVRSCELHAIEIQDRVFIGGRHVDRDYANQREDAFLVAVELHHRRRHLLLRVDGHRPRGQRRIRPGAHGAARRGAPVPGGSRQRPRCRRACGAASAACHGRRPDRGRCGRSPPPPPRWGAPWRPTTFAICWHATSNIRAGMRSPTGVSAAATAPRSAPPASAPPSRTPATSAATVAERTRVWDTCFSIDYSHIHGGSIRSLVARPLSPVDDAQARDLDRSIRRPRAASAAGAASPGARSGSTSPKKWPRSGRREDRDATTDLTASWLRSHCLRDSRARR